MAMQLRLAIYKSGGRNISGRARATTTTPCTTAAEGSAGKSRPGRLRGYGKADSRTTGSKHKVLSRSFLLGKVEGSACILHSGLLCDAAGGRDGREMGYEEGLCLHPLPLSTST